jgi:hypothetical protein
MKKLLLTLLTIIPLLSLAQYNDENANDAVMVISENCYVYNTPQTIPNYIADTTLTKLPKGLPIITNGYKNNYYKINLDGKDGYIFCLHVTTPKRMRKIQERIQFKQELNIETNKTKEIIKTEKKNDEIIHQRLLDYQMWTIKTELKY